MNGELCKQILKDCGKTVASKSELDTLREVQKRFDAANAGMTTFNRHNAHAEWVGSKADLVNAVQTGTVPQGQSRTLQDWENDYRQKTDACREAMRLLCTEALPLCMKIRDRFCAIASDYGAKALLAEKSAHDQFGIPHRPSPLVDAFSRAAQFAISCCPSAPASYYSPRTMLPYLDI
jgi:hypothetical protein